MPSQHTNPMKNVNISAMEIFTKVINDAPTFLEGHVAIAQALCQANNPEAAKQLLTAVVQLAPSYAPIFVELGHACLLLNDFNTAFSAFKTALSLDSNNERALAGLKRLET